ncbi:MAG: FAD-dependent oxidoreductase [Parvularculaceae bacterium]
MTEVASKEPVLDRNRRLTSDEIDALRAYGETRAHAAGDTVFDEGDVAVDACVVLSGQLDVHIFEDGEKRRVGWLEPGQFSGDVSLISGQPSLVSAVMAEAGELLHIAPAGLQRLLVDNSELSDAFVTTFLARRAWARAQGRASVALIGRSLDQSAFAIRDLLTKFDVPHLWVEADHDPKAKSIVERLGLTLDDTPILVAGSRAPLVRPSVSDVSERLGLDLLPDGASADVAVVGAGPAGLAASVYAASEGLSVVTIDAHAPGGQAGTSSKIENYLGFPTGVSGQELAERARVQAQKFGVRLAAPVAAVNLAAEDDCYRLELKDGRALRARAVVVATGAEYRRLPIDGLENYEGRGVYYGATAMEAQICVGSDVAIVGAGNSAGQGAAFLSRHARNVHLLYRRPDIRDTMSEYLVRRLEETPNVHFHPETEVNAIRGDGVRIAALETISAGAPGGLDAKFLFLFIGAAPCADWLPASVARDDKGFLKTGGDLANLELVRAGWSLDRMPSLYETAWPRSYAVGDVRAGSVKRVASGVGEGSVVVQIVHRAIAEMKAAKEEA